MTEGITLETERRLYVIHTTRGYSCLGFDICEGWTQALERELGIRAPSHTIGTLDAYRVYLGLIDEARRRNQQTTWQSSSQLTSQLVGLEGCRVEVVDVYNETRRFYVGKSTGFIPCHLEIARRNSSGGPAVTGAPFKSVRILPAPRR